MFIMLSDKESKYIFRIFLISVSIIYVLFLIMVISGNYLDERYFMLYSSSLISLFIVFLFFYLIYLKNKRCTINKLNIYEQIRNIENELFSDIKNNLELVFSKDIKYE